MFLLPALHCQKISFSSINILQLLANYILFRYLCIYIEQFILMLLPSVRNGHTNDMRLQYKLRYIKDRR